MSEIRAIQPVRHWSGPVCGTRAVHSGALRAGGGTRGGRPRL